MNKAVYEEKTEQLLLPITEAGGYELVDVEFVKEGGSWYLRGYIDKSGGVTVDDCERVSRSLEAELGVMLINRSQKQGIGRQHHHGEAGERHDVEQLPEYRRGEFYIQDAAAKLAVIAGAPLHGQRILDACAAPGGKTFAAAILSGGAEITACDIHEKKLRRINDGAQRLGLQGIELRAQDARAFVPEFSETFDLVIADVPCSGLGVIRKKPDIRYKDPQDFQGLPAIQSAILRNVSRYVRPGGTIVYSTCTIRPEENHEVCAAFLAENPDFFFEDFTLPNGKQSSAGMLQLWPQRDGTDGFFIAKIRKRK